MCSFILTTVNEFHASSLKSGMGYSMEEIGIDDWENPYHIGDKTFRVTDGFCSCHLVYFDQEHIIPTTGELELIRQKTIDKLSKPKYRKRGWTKEKVLHEAENRVQKAKQSWTSSVKPGLTRPLVSNIEWLLQKIPRIGLYVYYGHGEISVPLEKEEIKIDALILDPSKIQKGIYYDITA